MDGVIGILEAGGRIQAKSGQCQFLPLASGPGLVVVHSSRKRAGQTNHRSAATVIMPKAKVTQDAFSSSSLITNSNCQAPQTTIAIEPNARLVPQSAADDHMY